MNSPTQLGTCRALRAFKNPRDRVWFGLGGDTPQPVSETGHSDARCLLSVLRRLQQTQP